MGSANRGRTGLRWIRYGIPGALNPIARCELSQKGLWVDSPQRQRVARGRASTVPSSYRTSTLPVTSRGPLRTAVIVVVASGSSWAPPDDVGDLVCARRIGQDPGSPVELEDLALTTQALGNVDADVEVESDLDVLPVIELPH